MKMKRGTDHSWEVRKYLGDIALYAHCNCGFQYCCSSNEINEDSTWSLRQTITKMWCYCPNCGARKKWYNEVPCKMF